jgi:hypothetical protein
MRGSEGKGRETGERQILYGLNLWRENFRIFSYALCSLTFSLLPFKKRHNKEISVPSCFVFE